MSRVCICNLIFSYRDNDFFCGKSLRGFLRASGCKCTNEYTRILINGYTRARRKPQNFRKSMDTHKKFS